MGRSRPDAADEKHHSHPDRVDGHGETQVVASTKEGNDEQGEQRDTFGEPGEQKKFADAVDMRRLECHVGGITNLGEQRVVNDVNGPDESDEKKRGDEMDHDEGP